ncbi:nSTAND1 domain-containing NTPase [Rhizobium ruizarguesonis]|jgi:hypothetical protein|uniref:nSTAND1 domain-containing NTPase n=1 Tax=Rhizobium ruizarguesonis TaxID=2081791 RepID=UPI0003745315|nr:hypothetical protein [Rhizobium ruizarguesonis]TAZ86951.1 hypothetical protein ELH67_33190 [Rhizobium ruizarguesonis]TBA31939.1 hypothetical protein ELH60_25765 [Rhizobium ruizarguesonis]TBA50950.1 hypothetical protein ELH59_31895 [Rhizobium ruizarguesonis]TBA95540.1 hypothetical protein ELH55_29835 [Rhizobium ruizarguesonis]TBB36602.1 hypothetical protein ELH46_32375 [Rhizobium ruizarguesonis]
MLDRKTIPGDPLSPIERFRQEWDAEALRLQSTRFIPYPGLRSFNVDERPIFKARAGQIEALEKAVALPRANGSASHVIMVIGGSSSGKSSIVKAGLLAGIHSLEMPGEPGNWYIAECRPVKSPMQEVLQGLATMLIDAVVKEASNNKGAKGAAADARAKRIKEALEAAVPGCPMSGDDQDSKEYAAAVECAKTSLGERIWGERQRAQPGSMIRAFSAFVHVTLDEFDRKLFPDRSGRPRLLLSIDQFEEIFRSDEIASKDTALREELRRQKEAVFELIRSADRADRGLGADAGTMGDGDDCKLLVVTSMRSEEVHRCSQEPELAEVFNRAVHLVQLVMREDAEAAIIEPAQLTLIRFDFPHNGDKTYPYTSKAVTDILDAYEDASTTVEHRADALSLLQHFLRLLWQCSADAWVKAEAESDFLIDDEELSRIPGWEGPALEISVARLRGDAAEGPHKLARILNARARTVLDDAIAEWCRTAESGVSGGSRDPQIEQRARSVLQAALVSIVRFDDNRRVVRDWKTLDEMLDGSKAAEDARAIAAESEHDFDQRFRQPLRTALLRFEEATLIERRPDAGSAAGMMREDKYAVYHESLIRNWAQYDEWVREAGKAVAALRDIHDEICAALRSAEGGGKFKSEEIVTIGRESDLRAVIGTVDGLSENVAQVVSENERAERRAVDRIPWASEAWAVSEIRRAAIGAEADLIDFGVFQETRRQAITARYELFTRAEREEKRAAQEAERAAVQAARAAEAEKLAAEAERRLAITERQKAEAEKIAVQNEREVEILRRRKERGTLIFSGLLVILLMMSGIGIWILNYFSAQELNVERERVRETGEKVQAESLKYASAKIGRIGSESSDNRGGLGREPYQDRDAWLALRMLAKDSPLAWTQDKQSQAERFLSREKILQRMRPALEDSIYSVVDGAKPTDETAVDCSTPVKREVTINITETNRNSTPRTIVYQVKDKKLYYQADDDVPREVGGLEQIEDPNAIFCASLDGNALLYKSQRGPQPWVYIVLTNWNRWNTSSRAFWGLQALPRYTQTRASAELLDSNPIGELRADNVRFIRDGNEGVVGFRLPISIKASPEKNGFRDRIKSLSEKEGFIWTNDGFSAVTVDQNNDQKEWKTLECKAEGETEKCAGWVNIDGSRKFFATYYRSKANNGDCASLDSPDPKFSSEYCSVRFEVGVHNEKLPFVYQGRPPLRLRAANGWVSWVGDDGIVRKIDLRFESLQRLLNLRLQSLPEKTLSDCTSWPTNASGRDLSGFYDQPMPDALGGSSGKCTPGDAREQSQ